MMTTWRPKTGRNRGDRTGRQTPRSRVEVQAEEKCFFVGVLSGKLYRNLNTKWISFTDSQIFLSENFLGTIYYLKESGSNEEILSSGSSIRSLLFYSAKEILIILTEAQIMGHFRVSGDGDLSEVNKVR